MGFFNKKIKFGKEIEEFKHWDNCGEGIGLNIKDTKAIIKFAKKLKTIN